MKAGVLDVGFKPFAPQGEAGSEKFPLVCVTAPRVGFVVRLYLSLFHPL